MNIKMKRVTRGYPKNPGSFKIIDRKGSKTLIFACPNSEHGGLCSINVDTDQSPRNGVWFWNGDPNRPTISPSINCVGGCKWHGHITDGQMTGV